MADYLNPDMGKVLTDEEAEQLTVIDTFELSNPEMDLCDECPHTDMCSRCEENPNVWEAARIASCGFDS